MLSQPMHRSRCGCCFKADSDFSIRSGCAHERRNSTSTAREDSQQPRGTTGWNTWTQRWRVQLARGQKVERRKKRRRKLPKRRRKQISRHTKWWMSQLSAESGWRGTRVGPVLGVSSVDEVSGGTSKVRNMTCAREDDYCGRQHTKNMYLVRLSHAREKIARVMRAKCGVLFTSAVCGAHEPQQWRLTCRGEEPGVRAARHCTNLVGPNEHDTDAQSCAPKKSSSQMRMPDTAKRQIAGCFSPRALALLTWCCLMPTAKTERAQKTHSQATRQRQEPQHRRLHLTLSSERTDDNGPNIPRGQASF